MIPNGHTPLAVRTNSANFITPPRSGLSGNVGLTPRSTSRSTPATNGNVPFTPLSTGRALLGRPNSARSVFLASCVVFVFLLLMYGMKSVETTDYYTKRSNQQAVYLPGNDPWGGHGGTYDGDISFTCPDGRRGLQVVATRFLLGQHNASASYIASRLVLMNTFFVAALNGQTKQQFVVVIHHEDKMGPETMGALREVVSRIKVPVIYHTTYDEDYQNANAHSVSYRNVTKRLVAEGLLPKDFQPHDIYLSSRLDMDDAVNRNAVDSYHKYACGIPLSDTIGECANRIRLIYPTKKILWQPSNDTYGSIGLWKHKYKLDRWLPTLSTMVVVGADAVVNMRMNIYGFNHARPWDVALGGPKDKVCYRYNRTQHLVYWEPPNPDEYSGIYTRTAGASTSGVNKTIHSLGSANATVLAQFGISMPELVATNALFYGLQQQNAAALKGETANAFRKLLSLT